MTLFEETNGGQNSGQSHAFQTHIKKCPWSQGYSWYIFQSQLTIADVWQVSSLSHI